MKGRDTRYFGFSSLDVAYSTECIRFQWMGFVPVRGNNGRRRNDNGQQVAKGG